MYYIPVAVYRFPYGEATNNGISSKEDTLYIPHPQGWVTYAIDKSKVVNLEEKFGQLRVCVEGRPMFGGNFAFSGDSRFRELISESPIKIFDRFEP